MRRSIAVWGGCVGLALFTLVIYLTAARQAGELVLPLDDVYIHFQYAKQIAAGDPYVYNPGLPPSSGATSLLYPYLLALGYALGFTGLALGYWALGLGVVALAGSIRLIYDLSHDLGAREWLALFGMGVFALTGSVAWHFMSGMETGLLIFFMLWTFRGLLNKRLGESVVAASLMAITRPEGAIMAVVASGVMLLQHRRRIPGGLLALVPVLMIGAQPLVNWLATGSAQAAGSSAKSILSMIPADMTVIIGRVSSNFLRMWAEFLTGYSPREGLYLPVPLMLLAIVGLVFLARRRLLVALAVLGWLLAVSAAVSTLDPAFWHFKRYQMPLMALLFPLAIAGLVWLHRIPWLHIILVGVLGVSVLWTTFIFQGYYGANSGYVRAQPLAMARWLEANTPQDAVVAVHDVGIMRYLGGRTTVDMVGLTTPGAAEAWRHGPGAVAEFMRVHDPQPSYVASYTDALGLSYIADTAVYGEPLVAFPLQPSDRFNVALAGAYQGIWRADWSAYSPNPQQPSLVRYVETLERIDEVNVASLMSEVDHDYEWENGERLPGFPTEVYQQTYIDCTQVCAVLDGGRRINGEERFVIQATPGADMVLITRLHPVNAGTFAVYANDARVANRVIPSMPGQWLEVGTVIPGDQVTERTQIRVVPDTPGGHYMPYFHWAYQGDVAAPEIDVPLARFQDGAFALIDVETELTGDQLELSFDWSTDGSASGNYRLFVHLYDDPSAPPVAQTDAYPLRGTTPPGNWLPGVITDTVVVDLGQLSAGTYTMALGFYDPATNERLLAQSEQFDSRDDGRLFLGDVEVDF